MKTKVKRMSKRTLAVFLGVLMLVTCLMVGQVTTVNAYNANSNAKIYFDTSNWDNFDTSHTVYCAFIFGDQSAQREILKMNSISNSRVYYIGNSNGYSGTWSNGLKGVMFFSSSSTGWNNGYENNKGYDDIVSWCGGYYTGVYGTDIYNKHAYYFSAKNATSGTAPTLDKDYNNVNTTPETSTAQNDSLWRYKQTVTSYYRTSDSGSYSYVGDNNGDKGGTVSVQGRYWDSWNGVSSLGYGNRDNLNINNYGDYAIYGSAARGTEVTVTATPFAGYKFDGWAWTANGEFVSTSTTFTYSPVKSTTNIYAHFSIDSSNPHYYLTGWLNGASETGNTHAFTNTSGTTWTYSFTPSRDEGGYQYMTIKKSDGTAYHPANPNSESGTAGTTTNTDPSADNKWRVAAVSGQTVTLTWDSSTHVLSWTVTGGSSSGTLTDYKVLYSTSSGITGLSELSGAKVYNLGNGSYSVNFSSFLGNALSKSGEYYIAISKSSNYTDILGGGPNSTGTCEVKDGSKYFATKDIQSNYVSGNRYYYSHIKLMKNPNGLKYVVTLSGHTVKYDYYASDTAYNDGTGGDEVSSVNVYAKDGAAPINWDNKTSGGASDTSGTAYNYAAIATTAITKIDDAAATGVTTNNVGNASSQYQSATVEVGKKLTITTTISSSNSWSSKYYVKGWCINGVTYKCDGTVGVNSASDTSSGVCTLNYTIPEEVDVDYLEITPIYYLRTNTDCITFYLEGYNTVQTKWGNTPYIYPFYGNNDNVDNSFGCYPGQPMVYANGQYSIEIPLKSNNILNANNKNGTAIKGITINNGYADHVHRNMIYSWTAHDNDADHKQTYDYDDFYKIYEECLKNGTEHPNSIIFRIQDEETVYNRSAYGGGKSGQFASGTSNISIPTIASSGNGWELLTNRYDEAVNIFGSTSGISKPSSSIDPEDDTSNAIYVVSTGYNANIAGDYGTMWKIYNGSGELISKDTTNSRYGIPPSVLVMQGSTTGITNKTGKYPDASHSVDGVGSYTDKISQYEGIYKALKGDSYVNKRVYITYEKDAQDTRSDSNGTGAYRLDGRWYYTHASDNVQSTIGIEYYDKSTAKWVTDTVAASTGKGSTSGCTAKFNSNSYLSSSTQTTSSSVRINDNKKWNFTAAAGSGYMFDSWQIKYSDTSYDKLEGAGESASIGATANYTLVARFVPIVTGDLTIDHTLASASTGEGDVDMEVKVKNENAVLKTYTGSHIYIDEYISNLYSSYTIDVTLKTTPQYDGKVSAFGYDKFNTNKNINATTSPETLPGSENTLTTSHFSFTVGDLYAGTTITTTSLAYTSTITETPHYYNFKYNFTDRSGTSKSYTAKGTISQKEYKANVNNPNDHSLNTSFVVSKAPFESNFLKKNKLTAVTPSYDSTNHTFSAESTFDENDDVPTYHVIFKLPYNYYTESSGGTAYKKYNASDTTYNSSKATFDLAAKYNTFATIEATSTAPDTTQNKVAKVTDASDVNHTGNNFLTAPDTLTNGSTTMYFKYWEVHKGDTDQGDVITKIYYPDFNYRVYSNYYVKAVYSANASDSWKFNYSDTNDNSCSIIYLGDSRNQWNNGEGTTSDNQTDASDLIYNDFIFKYNNDGKELKGSSAVSIGMILERVPKSIESGSGYATGSASVSDMSSYKTTYSGTVESRQAAILSSLNNNSSMPKGCVKVDWRTSDLNNKNFMEQSYSAYSQYGQTVEDNSISFAKDSAMDDYVYRAYAYMKYDSNGDGTADKYVLSDPEYFCMKYTSSLKYSE